MVRVDVLIKNGRVIDPDNGVDKVMDVALMDKRIFSTGEHLDFEASSIFDASGCIVTPGLIDAHVHCYEYATPLGVNPDATCLSRGVTTVVDAGSSGMACQTLRNGFRVKQNLSMPRKCHDTEHKKQRGQFLFPQRYKCRGRTDTNLLTKYRMGSHIVFVWLHCTEKCPTSLPQ